MKGQMSRNLLGPEGAGILLLVEQLDSTHSNAIVIEVELFGLIDRMADFDPLADIGGRDFVESALEANGGVVIDDPFMADEEDLIEFAPGESSDEHPAHGSGITIDGPILDAGVEFMVIIVLQPESEGNVEFLEGHPLLESREEPFSDSPKEPLMVSLPLTV
jgi:hypothetical protein